MSTPYVWLAIFTLGFIVGVASRRAFVHGLMLMLGVVVQVAAVFIGGKLVVSASYFPTPEERERIRAELEEQEEQEEQKRLRLVEEKDD